MPSVSQKQHNLMAMVANNPAKAKELKIPQSVGAEFVKADKGKKFSSGTETRADLQKVNQPKTHRGAAALFKEGGQIMATKKMAKGGDTTMSNPSRERKGLTSEKMASVRTAAPSRDGIASKGKTKGTQIKMKAAGKPLGMCGGGMTKKK